MSLSTTSSRTWTIAILLTAIGALAAWTRVQFINLYGGHAASYAEWADQHYFGGLSSFYLSTSASLAAGGSYDAMQYPPGYPYLLAGLRLAGAQSVLAMRIVQGSVDAAAVVVVYRLARLLDVATGWALAAAAAYAVWPLFASGSIWPLADSLSVPLVAVAMLMIIWAGRSHVLQAAVCGLFIGAAALVRPDLVLLIVPAAGWLLLADGPRLRERTVALVLAFVIPIGLWGLHNRRVHGVWMFSSTASGMGLWEGLGELPNSYGYVLDDSAANHLLRSKGYALGSIEGDRVFVREYLNAWRDHPMFAARVIAARIPKILFESERLQPLFFGRARQLMDLAGLCLVIAALAIRRRQLEPWLLLLLPPLYAVCSIGFVHYEPRYVRYVQLSYVLAAFVLADALWRRLEQRRSLAIAVLGVVATGATVYTVRELHALHTAAAAAALLP
jgi:hypothetical protein